MLTDRMKREIINYLDVGKGPVEDHVACPDTCKAYLESEDRSAFRAEMEAFVEQCREVLLDLLSRNR